MKSEVEVLIGKISKREITNWFQFEIESSLIGVEVNSKLVKDIMLYADNSLNYDECDSGFLGRMRILKFIYNTLMNYDIMDRFFEDCTLVEKMIDLDRVPMYYDWMSVSDDEKPESRYFDANSILKKVDSRNPRYLLKFFLNTDRTIRNFASFMFLLEDIIERTFKRYKMLESDGNKELSEKFYDFYTRLCDKKSEFYERNRMMS